MTDHELITLCKRSDPFGQKLLFEKYVGRMTRLCHRYMKDEENTKDVLTDAFLKVFQNIKNFIPLGEGSLEAWIRKIVINQSLMALRKNKNIFLITTFDEQQLKEDAVVEIDLAAEDLYKLILQLPNGYRTIFNLFAIEGYSHKEIAEQLSITESASRSQLTHARSSLKNLLSKKTT